MDRSRAIPSVQRILWQDFAASLSSRVLIALWAFAVFALLLQVIPFAQVKLAGASMSSFLVPGAAAYSLLAIAILAWRITTIQRVFRTGVSARARVLDLSLEGGRGRLRFCILHDRLRLEVEQTIKRTREVEALTVDDVVPIFFDPDRPEQAFLTGLFLPD